MKPFSIFLPSWNNLKFLQKCVESIRKNSAIEHQIIVHVNEGSDGTLEWVKEQNLCYTFSPTNIGVCFAMNKMRTKVETDYICFINDDMYVLPGWDVALWEEIEKAPDPEMFFLSSSVIQPHTPHSAGVVRDYGDSIESFKEEKLLNEYNGIEIKDWCGATIPPNIVHRNTWDLVGGYSIEYHPGMYSDPDFTAKLWMAGVRYYKGVGRAKVYHFETKSTTRITKNDGERQFLFKWGITSSGFRKYVTLRGEEFSEDKVGFVHSDIVKQKLRLSKLKMFWYLLKSDMQTVIKIWGQ